jgi:hypothetical protein
MSFDNQQAIACRPADHRLAQVYRPDACAWEQTCGEPLMIVIGDEVTNEQCERLAARFDLSARDLIEFRDGTAGSKEVRR